MDSDTKGQIVVDMYQIEKMKQDLLNEMKVEMNKIKQDIIDGKDLSYPPFTKLSTFTFF